MWLFRSSLARFSNLGADVRLRVIGIAGSLVLRFINRSLRWERLGVPPAEQAWAHGSPRIISFWHGQQLMMPWVYLNARRSRQSPRMYALISQHNDGRIVAEIMRWLEIDSIAGSSSRQGREAFFKLIATLKQGDHIAVTPDGPKGPPRELKPGIIRLAERSGAPIYPVAVAAEHCWTFGSWDRMFLPRPFSRAVMLVGEPLRVPPDLSATEVVAYTKKVERAKNDLSERAARHWEPCRKSES